MAIQPAFYITSELWASKRQHGQTWVQLKW